MKSFGKPSFIAIFLFVFSATLLVLGMIQALFGTLRWYNASEESYERLQKHTTYRASDGSQQTGPIRVFILPKPKTASDPSAFIVESTPRREEVLATVTPEKAAAINQRIHEVLDQTDAPAASPEPQETFRSPVDVRIAPQ